MTLPSMNRFVAAASAAALCAMLSTPANATAITHAGSIFNASGGGVIFSYIHESSGGGSGDIIGGNLLDGGDNHIVGDLQYTWDTTASAGDVFGPGTTLGFNLGSTEIFNNGTFRLDLWTGTSSLLTVGAAASHTTMATGPVTNDVTGFFDFTITELGTTNVVSDTFNFSVIAPTKPVNGIGGNGTDFFTYLWGDTGEFDGGCSGSNDNCANIRSAFYGNSGLGIDIAFSGTAIPEPAVLALFGLGLIGLGLARRRRQTA